MNGMIKWMAEHPVAANLTIVFLLVAGLYSAISLPQQVSPEFTLDQVQTTVVYNGASPDEITQSIIRPIEDQLSSIDGIDQMTATATEGIGIVVVSLKLGIDVAEKLEEVKAEIERIAVFPEGAEEPRVVQASNRAKIMEIVLHGQVSERFLKEEAERLKSEIAALPSASYVEVGNTRDYEISIEIDREKLNAYELTLQQVASIVGANSLELPGGTLDTETTSIQIRTLGRNFNKADFEEIVIRTGQNGAKVRLGDVATVIDGFEASDLSASFSGNPSASVNVFRVGEEQLLEIVDEVKTYLAESFEASLPSSVDVTIWVNDADSLQSRLELLIDNAIIGLLLVALCLALFLDFRLAVWSVVGIGVSFVATFIIMRFAGMSINQISLFGFILAIGIVVDNAIVVGENIFKNGEAGAKPQKAAVAGAQRVAVPVVFSALTTVVAFTPLLQLPGVLGKFLGDIPTVVIIVLLLSLAQSLLILPRNLSKLDVSPSYRPNIVLRGINVIRRQVDRALSWFIDYPLDAILRFSTRRFLIPIAAVIATMILTVGLLANGYVRFSFFPSIEGELVTANIEMSAGTSFENTQRVADFLNETAYLAAEDIGKVFNLRPEDVVLNISTVVGQRSSSGGPSASTTTSSATLGSVSVGLPKAEGRAFSTREFEAAWRERTGTVPGVKSLSLSAILVGAGDPIALEISVPDGVDPRPVLDDVEGQLAAIDGVFDIQDDLSAGRLEYKLSLKDDAAVYGLQLNDLAQQMRNGFFGIEATRVQRGRDDVRVFVRLPEYQRDSISDMLATKIRTPDGDLIPLSAVADIREGLSPTEILRRDSRTINTVTADVESSVITGQEANNFIRDEILPNLNEKYPGVAIGFGGEQRQQGDAQSALSSALALALFVIFALLALVFRSYVQPIVVMVAIPLGLIGAVAGHLIVGIQITLLSIFGIIGLAGVVINNSLVMIDLFNEYLAKGMDTRAAVIKGTKDRFRPILLTSMTTFLGVSPLIMETSFQAQFLIPLAVSIGFGVLFGTVIIIFAIPAVFIAQAKLFRSFRKEGVQMERAANDSLVEEGVMPEPSLQFRQAGE